MTRSISSCLFACFRLGLLFLLLLPAVSARAQDTLPAGETVAVTAIDPGKFPNLSVFVAVNDTAGRRIPDLRAGDFALLEDGAPVSGLSLAEAAVGVQVVFVIDTSAAFKARDGNGVTRLEHLQHALTGYLQGDDIDVQMKDGVDDLTVLAPERLLIGHSSLGREAAAAVSGYTTDFAGAADSFSLINTALNYAAEVTVRAGMRRYVVVLSNGLSRSAGGAALDDLAARANAAQIPIYTVFVGAPGDEGMVAAQNLQRLSSLTGAPHLIFDNRAQSLAPLLQTIADQGTQYLLSYRSSIATTGQHSLVARVRLDSGQEIASQESPFPMRVEPPTVTVRDLPAAIERSVAATSTELQQAAQQPEQAVPITVDFPDGHPRALGFAQLVVDGVVVDTLEAIAADDVGGATLIWPLGDYAEAGTHSVQVRVADELGLAAESEPLSVAISVQAAPAAAPASAAAPPIDLGPLAIAGFGVLLAASLAVGAFAFFRRRAVPARASTRARPGAEALADTVPPKDLPKKPGTTPLRAPPRPQPASRFARLRGVRRADSPPDHSAERQGQAYFEVLEPGGGGAPRANIELIDHAMRLGRDAALVEVVFHDRSVSRLHARIEESPGGTYRIFDEGSTSGTWLNFTQIPPETGCELRPGDVINLGRVQLRFRRRDVPALSPANGTRVVKVPETELAEELHITAPHAPFKP